MREGVTRAEAGTAAGATTASRPLSPRAVILLIAALSMLQPLATDLYLPTLPGIARYFQTDVSTAQWTLSIFIAVFGLWQLIAGPLSDRFGRYPLVVTGAFIYFAAACLCGLAPTIDVLITGRALQAVGACTCLVAARGLIRDLYAPTEGARILAAAATIMSLAPLIGPIVGAYLDTAFGWRSSFAVTAAFALIVGLATSRALPETHHDRNPHALDLAPMLKTHFRIAGSASFRAYGLMAAATYAGLFAYLSGSSFVFIGVLGVTTTAFGYAFATMVGGYLIGTLICRRQLPRRGLQGTITGGAGLQLAAGTSLALLALAGVHRPLAIVIPMFFYGVSHGILQSPAQSGAIAPFAASAGAAAALLGFVMMLIAALVGIWIGASFNGTVYPLTLTIGAISIASAVIAFTLVRRDGDVAHHG